MIISILDNLLKYKNKSSKELQKILIENNIKIFNPIFEAFFKDEPRFIIFYILYAYSADSPWKVLGADFTDEKKSIAQTLQMPEYMYSDVVDLKHQVIRDVVVDYLEYQGKNDFKYLTFKQMQYEGVYNKSMKSLKFDEEGDLNTDKLESDTKILARIKTELEDLETKYREKWELYYLNMESEALERTSKGSYSDGRVESSQHIQ